MTDTIRTLAALQALLANNTIGAISPQDLRDAIVSTYDDSYNVVAYGADKTGLTDSTSSIQAAIDAAEVSISVNSSTILFNWITEIKGGKVYFPPGIYRTDSALTVPNNVSLVGDSPRNTIIFAGTSFSDTEMIDCVDGTDALSDSYIQDIRIHASNRSGITRVIRSQAWQENCGLRSVVVDGYQGVGILISDVSSGAAGFEISNSRFVGFSGTTAGIEVDNTVPNGFQLGVEQVTINPSATATQGLLMSGGILNANNLHIERATDGIVLGVAVDAYLTSVTGSATVPDVVQLPNGYTGGLRGFMIDPNGGTNALMNDTTPTAGFQAAIVVN